MLDFYIHLIYFSTTLYSSQSEKQSSGSWLLEISFMDFRFHFLKGRSNDYDSGFVELLSTISKLFHVLSANNSSPNIQAMYWLLLAIKELDHPQQIRLLEKMKHLETLPIIFHDDVTYFSIWMWPEMTINTALKCLQTKNYWVSDTLLLLYWLLMSLFKLFLWWL